MQRFQCEGTGMDETNTMIRGDLKEMRKLLVDVEKVARSLKGERKTLLEK